jgi:hypothetical protein
VQAGFPLLLATTKLSQLRRLLTESTLLHAGKWNLLTTDRTRN